ncbi:MAG: DsbA family protein [Bacillus sp. (in: Bacteria)]|nr:DsbA family protein [Bacillus sp. (in: firmicutes)]
MKTKILAFIKIIGLVALLIMSSLFLKTSFESYGQEELPEAEQETIYNTTEFIENRVFLGDEDAQDEIIFVLDYMCPFCKEWVEEIFVKLQEEYIDTGKAKFYSIPQVYLSKQTLALTEFTQKVEEIYPERYFDLLERIFADHGLDDWGSDEYIDGLAEEFSLAGWETVELDYDVIRRTRQVTRGLDVLVVPTIYINGRMVEDRMDYEEITNLLEKSNIARWSATGELCGRDTDEC